MDIIEEGTLKGSFKGFHNSDTIFEFQGGRKWRQRNYQYQYHYAYMPTAQVREQEGGFYLDVDGMEESVEVVLVR